MLLIERDWTDEFFLQPLRPRAWNEKEVYSHLKFATKPFNVLFACTRLLMTKASDKLRLKYPLLPTITPYPTMRLETKPVLEPHVKLGGITAPKVKHV